MSGVHLLNELPELEDNTILIYTYSFMKIFVVATHKLNLPETDLIKIVTLV